MSPISELPQITYSISSPVHSAREEDLLSTMRRPRKYESMASRQHVYRVCRTYKSTNSFLWLRSTSMSSPFGFKLMNLNWDDIDEEWVPPLSPSSLTVKVTWEAMSGLLEAVKFNPNMSTKFVSPEYFKIILMFLANSGSALRRSSKDGCRHYHINIINRIENTTIQVSLGS